MAHDGPPHDGAPHQLTPVYQTACRDARWLHRPSTQTECYEVWLWKDQVEYRRDGLTMEEGFVRKERR